MFWLWSIQRPADPFNSLLLCLFNLFVPIMIFVYIIPVVRKSKYLRKHWLLFNRISPSICLRKRLYFKTITACCFLSFEIILLDNNKRHKLYKIKIEMSSDMYQNYMIWCSLTQLIARIYQQIKFRNTEWEKPPLICRTFTLKD